MQASEDLTGKGGLVLYCDGSCRPHSGTGGYSGYGIFGHYYRYVQKPKNVKHPIKAAIYFNHNGISKTKETVPIEVVGMVEVIRAIPGVESSSNYAELSAVEYGLSVALKQSDLANVYIYSDSNYTVEGFNKGLDEWSGKSNWRRQDGNPIKHLDQWKAILDYREQLKAKGTQVHLIWVKGHNEDYANELSDLFSQIGSNASRVQSGYPDTPFNDSIYERFSSYKDYKTSYDNKDFVYHFKDLFFNSDPQIDDRNYCFISSTEDDSTKGRRATDSIFLAIKGYVPEFINRVKQFYRSLPRNYSSTCCIKLNNLSNRDLLRIGDHIPIEYFLTKAKSNRNVYCFVQSETAFLEENMLEFPFIMNINKLCDAMQQLEFDSEVTLVEDITSVLFKDEKLQISNKDRFLDLNYRVEDRIQFTQKLLLGVGYDMPNYLALKRLETEVSLVHMALHKDYESDLYTVFVKLTTPTREIYSVNVPNKFLAFRKA